MEQYANQNQARQVAYTQQYAPVAGMMRQNAAYQAAALENYRR